METRAGRLAAVLLLAGATAAAAADAPTAVRTILQRVDAAPGQEVIVATVDNPVGAQLFRHKHHGVEIGYVISGEVELAIDGQPARTYKAGESFTVPRDTVHAGHPVGPGPARTISTYVVDKGLPLAEPAP
jgi:quercetin dioxygenase-like cupin family protein